MGYHLVNINDLSIFVVLIYCKPCIKKKKKNATTILDLDFLKVWCNITEICPFQVMFEAINFVKQ